MNVNGEVNISIKAKLKLNFCFTNVTSMELGFYGLFPLEEVWFVSLPQPIPHMLSLFIRLLHTNGFFSKKAKNNVGFTLQSFFPYLRIMRKVILMSYEFSAIRKLLLYRSIVQLDEGIFPCFSHYRDDH